MKEILLTQGQVALVDDEDFEWLSKWNWCADYNSKAKSFYATRTEDKCHIPMARKIMECPNDKRVDHKNHNTLDNQKHNLRICTNSQNQQNRKKGEDTTSSKYKGVTWGKDREKWRAQIGLQDIFGTSFRLRLGQFDVEEEAALAYDDAAVEHFGKFAYLNFPRQK